MLGKVRPVGSRVPRPDSIDSFSFPWVKYYEALFTRSGTEALSLAVRAAIERKTEVVKPEVIIPAYGCPDLVAAIEAQGARAVLVDFMAGKPVMTEEGVVEALSKQTVAIIAVDFLGGSERLSVLYDLSKEHSVALIEDSAQRFPPLSCNEGLADFVVLSFGRGKPINLMGGGALLFRDSDREVLRGFQAEYPSASLRLNAIWHLKRLAFGLMSSRYLYPVLERMPFLHVGKTDYKPLKSISFLDIPLSLLAAGIRAYNGRKQLYTVYNYELAFLEQYGWKTVVPEGFATSGPVLRYALLAPSEQLRDRAVVELNRQGIGANAFYERILPDIMLRSQVDIRLTGSYLNARDFAQRLVTLPAHGDVSGADVSKIVTTFELLVR